MTDVVNPKSASPDQLLPYHKKISAEGKALMKCFISYTYMVLNGRGKPAEIVADRIIQEQRIDVDAVSGATNSSVVIKKAVENAFKGEK